MVALLCLIVALVVSTSVLVLAMAIVWWFDRYDREPIALVAAVFAWGMLAAPFLATAAEALGRGAMKGRVLGELAQLIELIIVAPVSEELCKAVGIVVLLALSRQFDNPTDGVVYGTAAGLGFAVAENFVYGVSAVQHGGMAVTAVVATRTVLSAGIHALATSVFGGLLGFALLSRGKLKRATWFTAGLIAASGLHAGWNFTTWYIVPGGIPLLVPAIAAVFLLYLLYLLVLDGFLRSERKILLRQLREEVEFGVLPSWVAEIIPFYRRRVSSAWWPSRPERIVIARLLTRLAFRKHAVSLLPAVESELAALEVVHIRRRLRSMLMPAPSDDTLGVDCQSSVEP